MKDSLPSIPNPLNELPFAIDAAHQASAQPAVTDINSLEQRVTLLENKRTNLNTDVFGMLETVSVVPAGIPKDLYDQIKIYKSGATRTLYIYDYTEQRWDSVALS